MVLIRCRRCNKVTQFSGKDWEMFETCDCKCQVYDVKEIKE